MVSSAIPRKKKKQAVEKKRKPVHGRIKLVLGLFFLFMALFAGISFISYLFSWKADQSFLDTELTTNLVNPDIRVDNLAGKAGAIISNLFIYKWFGISSLILVALFMLYGIALLGSRILPLGRTTKYGLIAMIWISVMLGYALPQEAFQFGGGHGISIAEWLKALMGSAGTLVVIVVTGLAFLVLLFRLTPDHFKHAEVNRFVVPVPEEDDLADDEFIITDISEEETLIQEIPDPQMTVTDAAEANEDKFDMRAPTGDYDPTLELSGYQFPGFDLLRDHSIGHPKVSDEELISNKNKIVETLANYKIKIEKIKATIGPTITLYEIIPAPGVRISKIKNLEDDIALSLSALGIRIIAPIPGRGTIGIEVPNRKPETVSMQTVLASRKFLDNDFDLPIALGKTISNETFVFDLTKMPHLLVAGATGQGKSVGINAIITSLLYRKHPSQLKFVMIDPKKVELTLYSKLEKHYLAKLPDFDEPIITDTQHVILVLQSLSAEMDKRYNLLKKAEVRNIKEYNDKFIKRRLNPEKGTCSCRISC